MSDAEPAWNEPDETAAATETASCTEALAVVRAHFDNAAVQLDDSFKQLLRKQLEPAYNACKQDEYRRFYQYELTPWLDQLQR